MPLKIEWHGLRLHTVVFKLSRESEKRVLHTWTGGDFFGAGEGGGNTPQNSNRVEQVI